MRVVSNKVTSWPTGLLCRFRWNDSGCSLLTATANQLFFQSLSSHTLFSCLEFLYTTNYFCNFWRSKFDKFSTYAACSLDDIFEQKLNYSYSNTLCKFIGSPSTFSTKTSLEWNLYLSWSNQFVTSLRLEMNVGGSSKHQNKTSNINRYSGFFRCSALSS